MKMTLLSVLVLYLGFINAVSAKHYCDINDHAVLNGDEVKLYYDLKEWSCDDYSKLSDINEAWGKMWVVQAATGWKIAWTNDWIPRGTKKNITMESRYEEDWVRGRWYYGALIVVGTDDVDYKVDEEWFCHGGIVECGI